MNKIKIENVSKKYGDKIVLNDINLSLSPGIYGIVGPNGAGKSTLLNILTTITNLSKGSVLFNNDSVLNNKDYRKILGYMPQQQSIPDYLTMEHFLYYIASLKQIPKDEADITIENLLKRLSLTEHKHKLNKHLSGGMRQRVLISQALLNDPMILILDEPTAGLDPIERSRFRDLIVEVSKDKIIIITSHIISDLEYIADTIILMQKGIIKNINTRNKLLSEVSVFVSMMTKDDFLNFRKDNIIVNYVIKEDTYLVRHFNSMIEGTKVETTLDDVYLYELS